MGDETYAENPSMRNATRRLHLIFGWWQLLVFLSLGIGPEMMHGFKVGWYLDADQETRRLMLTLAHTHGTLLGLVNLAFSWSVTQISDWKSSNLWVASRSQIAASVLMPLGFFLGGLITYAGDPNLAILLFPAGGFFLLVSALLTALAATKSKSDC